MNSYPMTHRTLAHPTTSTDGTMQHVLNYSNLEGFQTETVDRVNQIAARINELDYTVNSLKGIVDWIAEHRPQAIDDFHTTNRVANRMLDQDDEMMERQA
jgi:hypothetical protein